MDCKHDFGQIYREGSWQCKGCGDRGKEQRRPLTEHEALKLSWYRSEKKWTDNIRDRKIVTDRAGNKVVISQGKPLPMQPRNLWPEPKRS